jgi:large conductance mechanosensitive channel
MIKGFKDFLMRGNVIDLAVGIAIGVAFTTLVGAFGTYFVNPIIAVAGGDKAPRASASTSPTAMRPSSTSAG